MSIAPCPCPRCSPYRGCTKQNHFLDQDWPPIIPVYNRALSLSDPLHAHETFFMIPGTSAQGNITLRTFSDPELTQNHFLQKRMLRFSRPSRQML